MPRQIERRQISRWVDGARAHRITAGQRFFLPGSCCAILLACLLLTGCRPTAQLPSLPDGDVIRRGSLVVHTDLAIPQQDRLLDALEILQQDVSETLAVPTESTPIHVYLFEDQAGFSDYLELSHPTLPNRRAFFIKDEGQFKVFGFWGDRVAEDLRHEVTHGYIHSVTPDLPLWLDEGLAEYFEVTNGYQGLNVAHIELLLERITHDNYRLDLTRLESYQQSHQLLQIDYAEAWLWTHWLLTTAPARKAMLQDYIAEIRVRQQTIPISYHLAAFEFTPPQVQDRIPASTGGTTERFARQLEPEMNHALSETLTAHLLHLAEFVRGQGDSAN